jgi:hypothetical protein
MDLILRHRPQYQSALLEMDKSVLKSARSAIVRTYREFRLMNAVLDAGALAGIRGLTHPFDLKHITRALVRSLIAEGFNAWWDKSGLNGPYGVKVDWRGALNSAQRARRNHHRLRSKACGRFRVGRRALCRRLANSMMLVTILHGKPLALLGRILSQCWILTVSQTHLRLAWLSNPHQISLLDNELLKRHHSMKDVHTNSRICGYQIESWRLADTKLSVLGL